MKNRGYLVVKNHLRILKASFLLNAAGFLDMLMSYSLLEILIIEPKKMITNINNDINGIIFMS